jgi:hypothetical protein
MSSNKEHAEFINNVLKVMRGFSEVANLHHESGGITIFAATVFTYMAAKAFSKSLDENMKTDEESRDVFREYVSHLRHMSAQFLCMRPEDVDELLQDEFAVKVIPSSNFIKNAPQGMN